MTLEQAVQYFQQCSPEEVQGCPSHQEGPLTREYATDGYGPVDAWWCPATQRYVAVLIGDRIIREETCHATRPL